MTFELNLQTETVEHAFPAAPLSVPSTVSIREVFESLKKHNRGNILVCDADNLVGVFTERDALRLMALGTDLDQPISAVMTREPIALSAGDSMGKAISMMSRGGYRRLPIVDDCGIPQGVVKVSGILHYLVEHFPQVVYNLPPKPHHSTQEREGA